MSETMEDESLLSGRALRRRQVSRQMLARMLGEHAESEEEGDEGLDGEEGGDEGRRLVRLLVGSRLLRKRRVRRLMLAHLLREGSEAEDEGDEGEGASGEEEGGREHKIARLLIASRILRRRRVRRALLAHLLREKREEAEA